MRVQEPMDVEAAPDNRTLQTVYGDKWMSVAGDEFIELRRAGRGAEADKWASANGATLLRELPRVRHQKHQAEEG